MTAGEKGQNNNIMWEGLRNRLIFGTITLERAQVTHAASLQQQLTLAETVGAVGELHQGFLRLVSDGGVSSLVQLLTQDLQLGEALETHTAST